MNEDASPKHATSAKGKILYCNLPVHSCLLVHALYSHYRLQNNRQRTLLSTVRIFILLYTRMYGSTALLPSECMLLGLSDVERDPINIQLTITWHSALQCADNVHNRSIYAYNREIIFFRRPHFTYATVVCCAPQRVSISLVARYKLRTSKPHIDWDWDTESNPLWMI